jgi:hypothetical protein
MPRCEQCAFLGRRLSHRALLRMPAGSSHAMNKDRQRQCPQKPFKHEEPEEIALLEASQGQAKQ